MWVCMYVCGWVWYVLVQGIKTHKLPKTKKSSEMGPTLVCMCVCACYVCVRERVSVCVFLSFFLSSFFPSSFLPNASRDGYTAGYCRGHECKGLLHHAIRWKARFDD
ncbi:hypothetical protein BZA05DRAFT_385658 [Tricharina praecox]|uniref:uncharacterized protein n=1 Tax=Tricharina praecox TaxID=43433 RepID=UPI0022200ABF|nr:uncharacterized protein BZA05DRAFT_385658 [Tricharina praecox]KAI5858034.1 hypothetical protein BZA05DRAFT_385658 [Tricharina praecox]